jgi:hypothetical protein
LSCSGPNNWDASMAHVQLKNAGIITNDAIDFDRTTVSLLASEKIGKDLYRQIHKVVFAKKSGGTIEVITRNEASSQECSMSDVDVFVISQELGSNSP